MLLQMYYLSRLPLASNLKKNITILIIQIVDQPMSYDGLSDNKALWSIWYFEESRFILLLTINIAGYTMLFYPLLIFYDSVGGGADDFQIKWPDIG